MNKKDVLCIIETIASDSFFNEFVIRKSDNSIICKTDYGYKRVFFEYYNGYDLQRDDLALEIRPHYNIRFNILHKWLEKYSKRTLKDQREGYSIGFCGDMLNFKGEFFFLENRKSYDKDLKMLHHEVVKNANIVFSQYGTLKGYYQHYIGDVLKGIRDLPDGGFEWTINYLIATKIVAPSDYDTVKELILQRIEFMMQNNEPNTRMYYDDLSVILKDLDSTDFKSERWGSLSGII